MRPVPVIDHVVINVRDQMEDAAARYARLGFALTPQGRHSLGSINHLAMFGPDYLELLGMPPGAPMRADLIDGPIGLGAIAFATDDVDSVHAALSKAGVAVQAPLAFSRPVSFAGGAGEASFRVVRLAPQICAAGRLFFCQHLTRGLVWRNEWRRHANGALGILQVVMAMAEPAAFADLAATLFGRAAIVKIPGGVRLLAGLASIDALLPDEVRRRYANAAPARLGEADMMAALVLRAANPERVVVPAEAACGVTVELLPGSL